MTERRRFVADRFRRIWAVAQYIADEPGHSRRELADAFHLSERQLQADLNVLRCDMRLPLMRRGGYRFLTEGPNSGPGCLDLRDAQLLVLALSHARVGQPERMAALMRKLPAMFPPHLTPLVERTLEAVTAPRSSSQGRVFTALGDALLTGAWVRLSYTPYHPTALYGVAEPIVRPELLLPYRDSWYVVGSLQQRGGATRMLALDDVTAVTLQHGDGSGR